MYDLWEQIRDFLQPNDRLIFLGDAIDRGPDGYKIMCEMLSDPRITYIIGNHEYMMYHALKEIRDDNPADLFYLWMYNGGEPTYNAWLWAGGNFNIISTLKKLPYKIEYQSANFNKIQLCHAGYTPKKRSEISSSLSEVEKYDLVWNCTHFAEQIEQDNDIVIHGHTPVLSLKRKLDEFNNWASNPIEYVVENGIMFYRNNCKIDIDCGCVATGTATLLNLDTFETILFKGEPLYHEN